MSQTKAVVETIKISVDQIKPSPYQPRLSFDLEDIRGSIQRDGLLVPLTVRDTDGHYELIDGERRLRLAKELGYETVPCTVINVDDDTARRMVWKVNTLRQDYTPKEKAHHFRKFQDKYGMSLRGMAAEYGIDRHTIKAYLNTFRLSKEYQQMVWDRVIPIGVIKELEGLFNSGVYPPSGILTSEEAPEIFEMLDRAAREKYFGQKEVQESIRPYLRKLREEQIEKAKTVIAEVEPKVKAPETPEELEEAAKALRREAKRRKTPKQIREEKRDKAKKTIDKIMGRLRSARNLISVDEYQEQVKVLESVIEKEPDEALSKLRNIDTTLRNEVKKAREEREKKRLEEEVRQKLEEEKIEEIKEELRKDETFKTEVRTELMKEMVSPSRIETLPVEIPEEEAKVLRERIEQQRHKIKEWMQDPEIQKRGKLFKNWVSHSAILDVMGSAFCPNHTESSTWKDLKWSCGLSVEEAYEMLRKKLSRTNVGTKSS